MLALIAALASSPVITLPVIAALTLILILTILYDNKRLRDTKAAAEAASALTTFAMLADFAKFAEKHAQRRINKAIAFTFDTLKSVGFDKLARQEVTFEDILLGTRVASGEDILLGTRVARKDSDIAIFGGERDMLKRALDEIAAEGDGGTTLRREGVGGKPENAHMHRREGVGGIKPENAHKNTDTDFRTYDSPSPRAG